MDSNKIASEFQRQFYDDIEDDNCIRCHSKDHARKACKEPEERWEAKFDSNKDTYCVNILKWQEKAKAEKPGTKAATAPTLIQKESRQHTIRSHSPDDDDITADAARPLQYRAQFLHDDDAEDDAPPPISNL